jgi:hypothetical protein
LLGLLGLLALLFLFRRKKGDEPIAVAEIEDEQNHPTSDSLSDYISEYGLSDGLPLSDDGDGVDDIPRQIDSGGGQYEEGEGLSENNPDELDMGDSGIPE